MFGNKVVYQIYPKSFMDSNNDGIGDLEGIISKLDYLKDLGVDYIWLSPVSCSPQHDNGYDISDYYHIDPMFGGDEPYFKLISEAKKRGMKIMMDLVLNHVSSEHVWFKKALSGDEYYKDFFVWRDQPNEIYNFFGPTSWEYVEEFDQYYLHLFDVHQPDLNWENENVRKEIYAMVNYWIAQGVEGFRLDVIDLIGKDVENMVIAKTPKFYEYLKELHDNTFGDNILTVGECWNSSIEDAKAMCNEHGLSQIFHFEHLNKDHADESKWIHTPLRMEDVVTSIVKWQNDYDQVTTQVLNNHDTPRLISNWFNDKEYRYESATLAGSLFHLLNGTSYIYQGEEIGMTNAYMDDIKDYNDVETINYYNACINAGLDEKEVMNNIKIRGRDNARTPMQWNSEINGGFSTNTPWLKVNSNYEEINVSSDLAAPKSIYEYYKNLLKFKKENYEIINQPITSFSFEDGIISYAKGEYKVIANTTQNSYEVSINGDVLISNYEDSNKLNAYQFILFKEQEKMV